MNEQKVLVVRFFASFAHKHFCTEIFILLNFYLVLYSIPCGVNNRFFKQKSFCPHKRMHFWYVLCGKHQIFEQQCLKRRVISTSERMKIFAQKYMRIKTYKIGQKSYILDKNLYCAQRLLRLSSEAFLQPLAVMQEMLLNNL